MQILLPPRTALRLRPVDEYHLWRPEDGDATIEAGNGFQALLLPGFDRRALATALVADAPRLLRCRADGLLLLTDPAGRLRSTRGWLATPVASLRFAGIDAIRLT
jgi:hypothetical protein